MKFEMYSVNEQFDIYFVFWLILIAVELVLWFLCVIGLKTISIQTLSFGAWKSEISKTTQNSLFPYLYLFHKTKNQLLKHNMKRKKN